MNRNRFVLLIAALLIFGLAAFAVAKTDSPSPIDTSTDLVKTDMTLDIKFVDVTNTSTIKPGQTAVVSQVNIMTSADQHLDLPLTISNIDTTDELHISLRDVKTGKDYSLSKWTKTDNMVKSSFSKVAATSKNSPNTYELRITAKPDALAKEYVFSWSKDDVIAHNPSGMAKIAMNPTTFSKTLTVDNNSRLH